MQRALRSNGDSQDDLQTLPILRHFTTEGGL